MDLINFEFGKYSIVDVSGKYSVTILSDYFRKSEITGYNYLDDYWLTADCAGITLEATINSYLSGDILNKMESIKKAIIAGKATLTALGRTSMRLTVDTSITEKPLYREIYFHCKNDEFLP